MNFHLLLLWFNSDDASKLLVMMNVDSIWISAPKVPTGDVPNGRHLLDITAPNLKSDQDQNKQQIQISQEEEAQISKP